MNACRFFFLLTLSVNIFSSEIGLFVKKANNTKIKKIMIYSERSSGSNLIESLISKNLIIDDQKSLSTLHGHKHFPPWFDLPKESYCGPSNWYTFKGTEDVLFIVVFRNPYDWVRSLHPHPWHAHKNLCKIPFSQFIRTEWSLNPNEKDKVIIAQKKYNSFIDKDPLTGKNFINVLKLRTAKIKNMLMIKERVSNIFYVNYETVRDHPKEFLQELHTIFGLKRSAVCNLSPFQYDKGGMWGKKYYKEKNYKPISKLDLAHINKELNWTYENLIGYTLVE